MLKFYNDNEYEKRINDGLNKFRNGEISRNDFLNEYVNRHETVDKINLKQYLTLPKSDAGRHIEIAKLLEDMLTSNVDLDIKSMRLKLGPFRISDNIPNKREDNTGIGMVIEGRVVEFEGIPQIAFTMKKIDVVFEEDD